ncbi:MAG: 50S ribosomal protein L11 methyltransferase [Myxococcota bacterium]
MTAGCVVARSVRCLDPDEPALQEALRLESLGAVATDVEAYQDHAVVRACFDTPPPGETVERWLPNAERWPAGQRVEVDAVIEDRRAFGAGHHPTTAMMLHLARRRACPSRVLDVGTGTGILVLDALVRGAEVGWGVDISPEARASATHNAQLNHRCLVVSRDIPDDHRFDLVMANIRARTLLELASLLHRVVEPKGRLLLSGILFWEDAGVEAHFENLGFDTCWRVFSGRWWALELLHR